ncbi:MAG: hypothetical protein AB7W47_00685 [Calditrichaceae bacterium]
MLDQTVEIFIERLKKIVLTDQKMTSIPLAYLKTLDLPESIKHFFDQEVELWIREEEEKFTTTERFDYDMPEVRMLIDQIFDYLKQNAYFHVNKFNQLLERAVKLEMNYLIEPHRTLSQFLFRNSPIVSTIEVYDTLKYFFRYEYYKNAISDYFNMKYLREISEDQFVELVDQIDEKAFAENRVDTTLKTLKTIVSFIGEARQEQLETLSIDVLSAALKDRNLKDFESLVDRVRTETELSELTFNEIESLLRDGTIPGTEKEQEEATEVIGYDQVEDIETSKPEIAVDGIEVHEMQMDKVKLEEEAEEEDEEEDEVPETAAPAPVPESGSKGKVADDLAAHVARQIMSDTPLEDLNTMIKGRARRKILKKLFSKKENEFLGFLKTINELSTWKDASHVIDDEFYNRSINPYSKEAIALSDIIYMRFFPKDKYVGEKSDDMAFD